MTVAPLPLYPSTRARKSLSPSQSATLNQTISSNLSQVLELPPDKRDTSHTRDFVSSYAKDGAIQALESLIWGNSSQPTLSQAEKTIRQRVLLLAEKLASTKSLSASLDAQSLLDISIVYFPTNPSRLRGIFSSAVFTNKSLLSQIESEVVPAFTSLLAPDSDSSPGLYGLRKTSYCLRCLLLPSPPELLRVFAVNKPFMIALAKAYDQGLSSIASSYGGFSLSEDAPNASDRALFVEIKVALIDSFRALVSKGMMETVVLEGNNVERVFDILFELLELPAYSAPAEPIPYLNRPLITDYQDAYDFSKLVASALRRAHSEDARVDLLESQLSAISPPAEGKRRHAGALKLLLHSSGVPLVGIDLKGKGRAHGVPSQSQPQASSSESTNVDLDIKVTQVLDIFPDQSSNYIRALLEHPDYPFRGNPEKVIEALLEGTAPAPDDLQKSTFHDNATLAIPSEPKFVYTERRNVFDNEVVDIDTVRVGKKTDDAASLLRDRSFIEQMKASILSRVEELSDDEEDDGHDVGFEDGLDYPVAVKVAGDGEDSSGDEEEEEVEGKKVNPETVLELAYIRDQKLFERDAQTRRSKARADLKAETGWTDEQIEGWRIMLERNPKKEKILQKHEFAGNKPGPILSTGVEASDHAESSKGGRGRGRGRGRVRGGSAQRGGGDAQERAWKDKNKASRGNHNRKRGHDKKMAKAGGMPA